MSERALWQYMRDHLRHCDIDMQRHEDKLSKGVPDVSYGFHRVNGWIELKYIEQPKDPDNLLRCPHFTGTQRRWLMDRGTHGGHCFVMLQVGREYMLFDHIGCQFIGNVSLAKLRTYAIRGWPGKIDFPDLCGALREPSE